MQEPPPPPRRRCVLMRRVGKSKARKYFLPIRSFLIVGSSATPSASWTASSLLSWTAAASLATCSWRRTGTSRSSTVPSASDPRKSDCDCATRPSCCSGPAPSCCPARLRWGSWAGSPWNRQERPAPSTSGTGTLGLTLPTRPSSPCWGSSAP